MLNNRLPALRAVALALLALAASPCWLYAQDKGRPEAASPAHRAAAGDATARRPPPADAVSRHEITIGGRKLAYTAVAGTLPLTDDKGETTADVFYVSFVLDGVDDRSRRPITYVFNGGPGAASAYLDIGAIGPRALALGPGGAPPPPGGRVADNPDTWLPFTDLVFVDPVGTGYSRATGGDEAAAKEFWGVGQDLDSLGDIIRLHLVRSGRVSSPVYLVGESYGGFRAARLAYDLDVQRGIAIEGVVMVSPVIDFGLMSGGPLDPLPFALRLPSFAAAKLGAKSLEPGALGAAEQFALHDYLVALAAGPRDGPEAAPFYDKLTQLTGIDSASLKLWHGRIPIDNYLRDMDRRDGRVVSRYDALVSATDPNPWSPGANNDPVLDRSIAPFTSAFVAYAHDELGFKTQQPYELLNRDVARHWTWRDGRGGSFHDLGASDALRRALALEPRLRVMIAHGVTDLQTPFMMSRYIKDQMPTALGDRIALKLYAGGHMLYLHESSRRRLAADAKTFYAAAAAE